MDAFGRRVSSRFWGMKTGKVDAGGESGGVGGCVGEVLVGGVRGLLASQGNQWMRKTSVRPGSSLRGRAGRPR